MRWNAHPENWLKVIIKSAQHEPVIGTLAGAEPTIRQSASGVPLRRVGVNEVLVPRNRTKAVLSLIRAGDCTTLTRRVVMNSRNGNERWVVGSALQRETVVPLKCSPIVPVFKIRGLVGSTQVDEAN